MKRTAILVLAIFTLGYWPICSAGSQPAVQTELEAFRAGYEKAVRQRNVEALLNYYDEGLKNEVREYWTFVLSGGWGRMPFLDEQQAEDYARFRLLMHICELRDNEAIAVLAHDTGFPFINRYFLVSKYGPDVYRLIKQKDQWKIAGRVNPADLYDVLHQDLAVRIFPDTGEMAVKQLITAKRIAGDGGLFISWIHEGMKVESIESPQGDLDFSQLASTVAVRFKQKPVSDTVQFEVRYRGKAGEWFVSQTNPNGLFINIQRIEPHVAIVREENSWHLQTDPARARLAITVPKEYRVLSSTGVLTSVENNDEDDTFFWDINEPVTEFGFLAGDEWSVQSKRVGEITLSVYLRRGNTSDPEEIMKNAEEIISVFDRIFGPTLPHSFALVDFPFGWNRPNFVPLFGGGRVSVHEMAHYWWVGAFKSVEPRAFHWFTEGFATYSEALYEEAKKGKAAYFARIWADFLSYLPSYNPDVAPGDPGRTLLKNPDSPTRYRKGACVLHALRFVVGDEPFFMILKNVVSRYQNQEISVERFREVAEDVYGKDLGWFFSEWLERSDLPEYRARIDKVRPTPDGHYRITILVEQTGGIYKMPLEIVAKTEDEQVTERVWAEEQSTSFEMATPWKPVSVELDPSPWILRGEIRESPAYRIEEFLVKQKWGKKSSAQIAGQYSEEWLNQVRFAANLSRTGFALYDVGRYEEALKVFKRTAELYHEQGDRANRAIYILWQGHMLDLLLEREKAIATYKSVADMHILDSGWATGLYNLKYEPTISGYAERRMKEPFLRLENQAKN